jgi:crotonobetainyl-CoA:carnitine CoA-transferase CaiB-like acyl-CoA transferase
VVVANFSPGTLDKLGLGYHDFEAVNPAMIVIDMPALGNDGPYGQHVGMGQSMEAASGMTSLIGYGDGPPMLTGYAYLDPIGGLNGAAAAMVAIEHRRVSGRGQYVEVPQVEAAMHLIGAELAATYEGETLDQVQGNHRDGELVHDAFPCQGEDEWVAIACSDVAEMTLVLEALEDDVARHGEMEDVASRAGDDFLKVWRDRVTQRLKEIPKDEAAGRIQEAGVRAGPVYNGKDLAHDPHMWSREFFVELSHPECGTHYYPGLPYKFSLTPGRIERAAPCFGEHNRYVLTELLGMSDSQVEDFELAGILAGEAVLD